MKRFNSALVTFVLALVRAGGADAKPLEKKYLRIKEASGNALPEVSLKELGALMEAAATALGDPLFGLHCALMMPRGSYGLLEFGLRAAPTGRKAMEQLASYGALINPLVRWTIEEDGGEVALHHRAPQKEGVGRQANMFTVARITAIAREMLGDEVAPLSAWFAHREASCPPELAEFLRTKDIRFGCASNGVAFSAADMDRTPRGADPELNRALEAYASAVIAQAPDGELYESARRAVLELLPRGDASLARTARALHVTARTLQRRLADEGIAFGKLLEDVRRAQAERLLARTDAPLADVAEGVGYADTAAFVRAFKKWSGTTPGRFRDERRGLS